MGLRRRRDDYDIVVIGGGSAGLTIGRLGPQLGARVAIVEAERLGGDCTWHGCVPSKALLAAGRAAVAGRDRAALGLPEPPAAGAVEIGPVLARIRALQEQIYEESDRPETLPGVDVIPGRGRFVSPSEVEVDGRRLRARTFVIATGSSPVAPPIPGLATSGYLTNRTVFDIERLPARLTVIGGGPTGLELGQAFQRLGSAVTVVEAEPRILARAEAPVSAALREALAAEGMSILTDTSVVEVVSEGGGNAAERVVRLRGPDGIGELRADAILVAAGQRPNVDGLGLEAAGVALAEDGALRVDARLRTSNRRVYACGDVTGGHQFTHAASYEAGVVLRNALFPIGRQRVGYRSMPWVVFTDPEVAGVGLSEAAARARHGDAVHVYERSFREVDRALIDGRTAGFLRMVTAGRRRRSRRGADRGAVGGRADPRARAGDLAPDDGAGPGDDAPRLSDAERGLALGGAVGGRGGAGVGVGSAAGGAGSSGGAVVGVGGRSDGSGRGGPPRRGLRAKDGAHRAGEAGQHVQAVEEIVRGER